MRFNPLRTLAGRLVLVTIAAIAISHIVAFSLFANERTRSFRREAEAFVADHVVEMAERVRPLDPTRQAQIAEAASHPAMMFAIVTETTQRTSGGAAARIARAVSQRLDGAPVRAHARQVEVDWRHRMRVRRGPDGEREIAPPPDARPRFNDDNGLRTVTEVTIDAPVGEGRWLRARAFLPAPRPAPAYLLVAAFASMIAVGLGAFLISRQIGRPLADLARAAERFGWGETHVATPVSGPEDVRRASSAFNAMANRLGRQMGRQRQMLWALSHDLRTPITALRLRAELIEDDAARQRLLGPIAEMEVLTEQALSLARAGASEEARAQVDLAEIARTLCGELEEIGVNVRAETETPVMAECRPSEIARAMRNLAENAARHGGGGVMRVYRGAQNEAVIEVLDEGPGLPPDQIARVTEPFFRADAARSQSNGAGLGLAIVQAIADGHGGRLVLENRTPRGLSVKLILPA